MPLFRKRHAERTYIGPPYPPGLAEQARGQAGGWVYEIAGDYEPDGSVPPERIKGGWEVGPDGSLTGWYVGNPKFRGR